MDWAEERYVRVYTRDTVEWSALCWEAQAVWLQMLRKFDRTGAIALGKLGRKGLAGLLRMPLEIIEAGLNGLVEDGCIQEHAGYIIAPNFLEAQEAKTRPVSAAERQQSRREKLKAKVSESQGERHAPSRNVTAVTKSHDVTPVPSLAVPSRTLPKEDSSTCVDPPALEDQAFAYWAEKLGHPRAILDDKRRKLLKARGVEGMDLAQAKLAVDGVLVDIQQWPDRRRFDGIDYVFESRASVEKFMDLALKGNPRPKRVDAFAHYVEPTQEELDAQLKAAGLHA